MIVYHHIVTFLWHWDAEDGQEQSMATISGISIFDEPQTQADLYHHVVDEASFQCRAASLSTDGEIPDRAEPFVMFYRCEPNTQE